VDITAEGGPLNVTTRSKKMLVASIEIPLEDINSLEYESVKEPKRCINKVYSSDE
jgi:hypothetical protein